MSTTVFKTLNIHLDNYDAENFQNFKNAIKDGNVEEVKKYTEMYPEYLRIKFYHDFCLFILYFYNLFYKNSEEKEKEEENFDIFKIFIKKDPIPMEEFLFKSSSFIFKFMTNKKYDKYIYLLIETYDDKLEKFLNEPRCNNYQTYLFDTIKDFNREIQWLFINLRVNTSVQYDFLNHVINLWINFIKTYKKMIYFCFSSKKYRIPKEINQFISLKLFLKEK